MATDNNGKIYAYGFKPTKGPIGWGSVLGYKDHHNTTILNHNTDNWKNSLCCYDESGDMVMEIGDTAHPFPQNTPLNDGDEYYVLDLGDRYNSVMVWGKSRQFDTYALSKNLIYTNKSHRDAVQSSLQNLLGR